MTVTIRPATAEDAAALVPLIAVLGREVPASGVRDLIENDPALCVLVAQDGEAAGAPLLGVLALTHTRMLHRVQREARITTLAVAEAAQGRGVGRQLVEAAVQQARDWGCGRLELTTGAARLGAQAFYHATGFRQESLRFHRDLD
ncbi:GNAT family N-acetyltransferase [Roseomonas elaeocarpi]|uniref:GNAT family N-acetyltransferase n=1 Tax=Roseomonas elaeocarpi TaxID=907779 RepID=A0ABV6JV66_9PROT